jgi:cell wall-associated NlpC family hydrolase
LTSHRKPRPRILATTAPRAAVGVTAAALASVTLLSESASAAPAPAKPSISDVKKQVDSLNQQAEVATQQYDQAKEKTDTQRAKADQLLTQVAQKTQKMNETRRVLGQFAAQQYRDGGINATTQLLLSANPESFLAQTHMMSRLSSNQQQTLETFKVQQEQASIQRAQATSSLQALTDAQSKLATEKKNVSSKLAAAQKLLNSLNAEQRARIAAMNTPPKSTYSPPSSAGGSTGSYSGPASGRAAAAIAFALAQQGKPYVSGGTGPGSYDCSGLTQAAYSAAGISIGRTTWDQVTDGTAVSESQLRPGDLVFFYSGISHVGIYLGNGQVVHAPHTGGVVEIAPMSWMPFAAARRIA